MNSLFDTVKKNDRSIYDLAIYYETRGNIKSASHKECMDRFSEFKIRILKGSITLEQLEKDVLTKFGICDIKQKKDELSTEAEKLLKALEVEVEGSTWEESNE